MIIISCTTIGNAISFSFLKYILIRVCDWHYYTMNLQVFLPQKHNWYGLHMFCLFIYFLQASEELLYLWVSSNFLFYKFSHFACVFLAYLLLHVWSTFSSKHYHLIHAFNEWLSVSVNSLGSMIEEGLMEMAYSIVVVLFCSCVLCIDWTLSQNMIDQKKSSATVLYNVS